MPYPFAHPAAVIPLCGPMGRFAVPSALAIGSIAPDLWYLVPILQREQTHSIPGLVWFCLPVGLVAYLVFHLFFKHPVLALLPDAAAARLRPWVSASLPRVPWHCVVASLLAGAATHLVWDALTHPGDEAIQLLPWLDLHQLLQHGSTVLGVAFLVVWIGRKLREPADVPHKPVGPSIPPAARACIGAGLFAVAAIAAWHAGARALPASLDPVALRVFARTAGLAGLSAFAAALLVYGVLWRLGMLSVASRHPVPRRK